LGTVVVAVALASSGVDARPSPSPARPPAAQELQILATKAFLDRFRNLRDGTVFYISFAGKDPPKAAFKRFAGERYTVRPASRWRSESRKLDGRYVQPLGPVIEAGVPKPVWGGKFTVEVVQGAWTLDRDGCTVTLLEDGSAWRVEAVHTCWID
jgi:hypothetical protein